MRLGIPEAAVSVLVAHLAEFRRWKIRLALFLDSRPRETSVSMGKIFSRIYLKNALPYLRDYVQLVRIEKYRFFESNLSRKVNLP